MADDLTEREARGNQRFEQRLEDQWRASLTLALVLVGTGMVMAVASVRLVGAAQWQNLQAIAIGLGLGVVLLVRRRNMALAVVGFFIIGISQLVMVTANQFAAWHETWPFPPLVGHKVALIALAIIASSSWTSLVMIALYALDAGFIYHYFSAHAVELGAEPWPTLLAAALALGIVGYRHRTRTARYTLLDEQARYAAVQHVAHTLLAIRDLSNTPLQTLMLTNDLLLLRDPADPLFERMKRALTQIARINEIISIEEGKLSRQWHAGDTSFDAADDLEAVITKSGSS